MIDIFGAVAILLLVVLAFFGGMVTANWYNEKAKREERYSLETQYARLRANVDYHSPIGPYVSPPNGGQSLRCSRLFRDTSLDNSTAQRNEFAFNPSQVRAFEERLKNTGSATVLLKNPTKNNSKKEK